MTLSKEKIEEIEKNLKDNKLMDKDDSVIIVEKGDYWEKVLFFNMQTRGFYYFTNKAIVFIGGALGNTQFKVKYKNIKEIKKCNVAFFIPTAIKLTVFNEKKNKNKKYKLSLLKRDKWINFIEQKKQS